jgi:hypothetical protein
VFVSPSWETLFPLCSLTTITRIGSDHCPLILDNGEKGLKRTHRFFFQTWWFGVPGFGELVKGKICAGLDGSVIHKCSIDRWQGITRTTRQFLKGWGANLGKQRRALRVELLDQVANLDGIVDAAGLD